MKPSDVTSAPSTSIVGTPGAPRPANGEPCFAFATGAASSFTRNRIGNTRIAGTTATRNIARQPNAGTTKYAVAAASKNPTGQPACNRPDAIWRDFGGRLSIASAVPAVHSAPMPNPKIVRSARIHAKLGAK